MTNDAGKGDRYRPERIPGAYGRGYDGIDWRSGMRKWTRDEDYKPEQMPRPMTPGDVVEALGNGNREIPHVEKDDDGFLLWIADGQVLARVPSLEGEEKSAREFMEDFAHAVANAGPIIDKLEAEVERLLKVNGSVLLKHERNLIREEKLEAENLRLQDEIVLTANWLDGQGVGANEVAKRLRAALEEKRHGKKTGG